MSEKTKRKAIDIMNYVIKKEISAGKRPMALAAAVLYLSSINVGENNITQNDIAQAAGISQVTMTNRYRDVKTVVVSHIL